MKTRTGTIALFGSLLVFAALSAVAAERPYREGTVSQVAAIRTQPGMFDAYMQYLATTYKQVMEQQKAAGLVVDYRVYSTVPRGPNDPDLYLVVVYKNMAALDDLRDKMEPIQQKTFGDDAQRSAKAIERGKLRTQLGSELMRELILK